MDYAKESRDLPAGSSPARRAVPKEADSDTDFQARLDTDVEESGDETMGDVTAEELNPKEKQRPSRSLYESQSSPPQGARATRIGNEVQYANRVAGHTGSFKRVLMSPELGLIQATSAAPQASVQSIPLQDVDHNIGQPPPCLACGKAHAVGYCPLKLAGVEHCPLCGIAHYGHQRTCPHLNSITQCRAMLEALKQSPESSADIELAKKYLVGIIGDLQRRKRLKEEKALLESNQQPPGAAAMASSLHTFPSDQAHGPHAGRHPPLQGSSNFRHGSSGGGGPLTDRSNSKAQSVIAGSPDAPVNGTPNGTAPSRGGRLTG